MSKRFEVAWSAFGTVVVPADDEIEATEAASRALADIDLTSAQDVDGWNFKILGEA